MEQYSFTVSHVASLQASLLLTGYVAYAYSFLGDPMDCDTEAADTESASCIAYSARVKIGSNTCTLIMSVRRDWLVTRLSQSFNKVVGNGGTYLGSSRPRYAVLDWSSSGVISRAATRKRPGSRNCETEHTELEYAETHTNMRGKKRNKTRNLHYFKEKAFCGVSGK